MSTEKRRIERGTADGFLALYNLRFGTSFEVVEESDSPDIRCQDRLGNALNLEITTTEDQTRDMQAILGRSDHKSIESLHKHNLAVAAGKESPKFTSLSGAAANLTGRFFPNSITTTEITLP